MLRILGIVLLVCTVVTFCSAQEVSVACMMAYEQGGATAVFSSKECPQWEWTHPIHTPQNHPTANCEFAAATLQGHRTYQEDRIACNPAMKLPLLGTQNFKSSMNLRMGLCVYFSGINFL